ncbi:GNAT family N-acetyltransferase [Shewanella algae]|uniref:GNAT family N-acetyltransferase n=1 Tax=Shewanella algae TaxID=38313 RepID=UPI001FD57321|nr:GNAT family N-acetyltransferase [Shewanella algae]
MLVPILMLRVEVYSHSRHRHLGEQIANLYHSAVTAIDDARYSAAQRLAWSAAPRSGRYWQLRLKRAQAWVMLKGCEQSPQCVGFVLLETTFRERGYIACLYVAPDSQRQGVASSLLEAAKKWALTQGYHHLTTDASALSKPVFERAGFRLHHKSYQEKSGQMFGSYFMKLILPPLVHKS